MSTFELQGHRGARGLKPENTLPSFEAGLDAGVTAIETDLHLPRDGVIVLFHDDKINPRLCRLAVPGTAPEPVNRPLISRLTYEQLQAYVADVNPDPGRFPDQDATETPLAKLFADRSGMQVYGIPKLEDLFAFAASYAGADGQLAGKSDWQRSLAAQLRFDLELKRVPFHPEFIGDQFDGRSPGMFETKVVAAVRKFGLATRTTVRSFDHRSVFTCHQLDLSLRAAVLIAETAPTCPGRLACDAGAEIYGPDYRFLDPAQIRELHEEGIRVIPWTVNIANDWNRLLDWRVDGITTDYPDRLAELLRKRGIPF
jgi:glycerophosphoryl diester phosphodiesterase